MYTVLASWPINIKIYADSDIVSTCYHSRPRHHAFLCWPHLVTWSHLRSISEWPPLYTYSTDLTSMCHAMNLDINSIPRTVYLISSLGYLTNISHLPCPKLTPDLSSVHTKASSSVVVPMLVNENNGNHILLITQDKKTLESMLIPFFPLHPHMIHSHQNISRIWQLSTLVHHPSLQKLPNWSFCLGLISLQLVVNTKNRIILLKM